MFARSRRCNGALAGSRAGFRQALADEAIGGKLVEVVNIAQNNFGRSRTKGC